MDAHRGSIEKKIVFPDLRSHREFVLILGLAVSFRFMAILVFRPGGYLGEMSDFGYYRLLLGFTSQGYLPFVDFWLEYPPLFPWLLLGFYRLSLLIPPWPQPGAWFFMLISLFLAIVDGGNLLLFYNIGRRLYGQARAIRLAWIYTALLVPVLSLFVGFDTLALLFMLWSLLFMLDQRALASGLTAGLGFMTKLVPIAPAPAALRHLGRRSQRVRYLIALSLTLLLIAAPFLLTSPAHLLQSLASPVLRSTWETVWALIDGYYSYGVAGGYNRFDPAMAGAAQHPTQLPWPIITIGFALLYLALYTRRAEWADGRRAVAFTALSVNLLTLYFKGYSPGFLIMLLPFVLLLIPGWRGVAYTLLLSAINLIEYPVYFLVLFDEHWLLTGTVLLRTLILVVTSVEYAAQVYDWQVAEQWWRRIAAAVTVLIVVLGLVGAVLAFPAYYEFRYEATPHHPAMEILSGQAQPGASIVTDDQYVYEYLYPFFHKRFRVILVETFSHLPPWEPRLAQAAAQAAGQLWVYAPPDSAVHAWLAERYPALARHELDGWLLSAWDTR